MSNKQFKEDWCSGLASLLLISMKEASKDQQGRFNFSIYRKLTLDYANQSVKESKKFLEFIFAYLTKHNRGVQKYDKNEFIEKCLCFLIPGSEKWERKVRWDIHGKAVKDLILKSTDDFINKNRYYFDNLTAEKYAEAVDAIKILVDEVIFNIGNKTFAKNSKIKYKDSATITSLRETNIKLLRELDSAKKNEKKMNELFEQEQAKNLQLKSGQSHVIEENRKLKLLIKALDEKYSKKFDEIKSNQKVDSRERKSDLSDELRSRDQPQYQPQYQTQNRQPYHPRDQIRNQSQYQTQDRQPYHPGDQIQDRQSYHPGDQTQDRQPYHPGDQTQDRQPYHPGDQTQDQPQYQTQDQTQDRQPYHPEDQQLAQAPTQPQPVAQTSSDVSRIQPQQLFSMSSEQIQDHNEMVDDSNMIDSLTEGDAFFEEFK